MAQQPITIRPPTFSTAPAPTNWASPTVTWLTEIWHVTHSSLPLWKDKHNVTINYTPLPPSTSSIPKENSDRIDDLVSYQKQGAEKVHTIHGIDTLAPSSTANGARDAWDWRGKGWLKIASSHWEVLGYGEETGTGKKWVVTCFAATMFTPAGIDIYSQDAGGLGEKTLEEVKGALGRVEDEGIKKMVGDLFQIGREE
ncbi:hypothetical protein LTR62_008766 [Meristemomyces frigidus]|uniref:Uncharacterized protein n=1 Tax=Meristemomyces frigidus TaxID=1508187 RepID=A0AAN7YLP4_9PEZI|nr:hypothetical protein LTR62_008766 [Meristemomyces frigidus]